MGERGRGTRPRARAFASAAALAAALSALCAAPAGAAPAGAFTTVALPPGLEGLGGIATAHPGDLWFTARSKSTGKGYLGKVSGLDGAAPAVSAFPVPVDPREQSQPAQIVAGTEYELWFSDAGTDRVGRVTFASNGTPVVDEFDLPSHPGTRQLRPVAPRQRLWDLAVGSDGSVWYATTRVFKTCQLCSPDSYPVIGKISNLLATPPVIEEFPAPAGGDFTGIAAGPDGSLWYSRDSAPHGKIGRVSNLTAPAPAIAEFSVPMPSFGCFHKSGDDISPGRIAAGPDGGLWFGAEAPDFIGCGSASLYRISNLGAPAPAMKAATHFWPQDTAHHCHPPPGIASGPDNAMWLTAERDNCSNDLGSLLRATGLAKPTPDTAVLPFGQFAEAPLAAGPEGGIWSVGLFGSEPANDRIARISTGLGAPQYVNPKLIHTVGSQTSSIVVSGRPGKITSLTARLLGLNARRPANLDVLLVGPDGRRTVLMSDAGAGASGRATHAISISNGPGPLYKLPAHGPLTAGRYKPTNHQAGPPDAFPGLTRANSGDLGIFTGADPNGTWTLHVRDDGGEGQAFGSLTHGWGLDLQTDAALPLVTGLSVTNKVFKVGPGATALSSRTRRRKRAPRGTTFRYRLSERATVVIRIQRARRGVRLRRRGARRLRCALATRANRRRLARQLRRSPAIRRRAGSSRRRALRRATRRRRCTSHRTAGRLTRAGQGPGAVRTRFSGRIGTRKLRPGRYRALLTATDAALNRSRMRSVRFRVVRR